MTILLVMTLVVGCLMGMTFALDADPQLTKILGAAACTSAVLWVAFIIREIMRVGA